MAQIINGKEVSASVKAMVAEETAETVWGNSGVE